MEEKLYLTPLRLLEYPSFGISLAKKILEKIEPEIQNKITVVIGVIDLGVDGTLAYNIARALNEKRAKNTCGCRAIYCKIKKTLGFEKLFPYEGFVYPKRDDFVLFVHCCFDDENNHVIENKKFYELFLETNNEHSEEFVVSELLRDEKERTRLFKDSPFYIDSFVILPTPKKEYLEFMEINTVQA